MKRTSLLFPAAALVLASAGCPGPHNRPTGPPPPLTEDSYPFALRSPAVLDADFTWRQEVTARFGSRTQSMEAVLEKKGDAMTVLFLAPFGAKAFVIQQKGLEVTTRKFIDRDIPFPPRFILYDIQRAHFPWIPHEGTPEDGEHSALIGAEQVVEVWKDGLLRERRFQRTDNKPPGTIRVRYFDWSEDGRIPEGVVIDNGWFGYRLGIKNMSG